MNPSRISVESFCRVLSLLGAGKISPETLRKAKHQELDEKSTLSLQKFLSFLCQNIICPHEIFPRIEPSDLILWIVTIIAKFNIIDSLYFKIMNRNKFVGCLKLENLKLFQRDLSGIKSDEQLHLVTYYNLKIKSYELNFFEKRRRKVKNDFSSSVYVQSYEIKLKNIYRTWKSHEHTFWNWIKIDRCAMKILPQISTMSSCCKQCKVHVLPQFLWLNNYFKNNKE